MRAQRYDEVELSRARLDGLGIRSQHGLVLRRGLPRADIQAGDARVTEQPQHEVTIRPDVENLRRPSRRNHASSERALEVDVRGWMFAGVVHELPEHAESARRRLHALEAIFEGPRELNGNRRGSPTREPQSEQRQDPVRRMHCDATIYQVRPPKAMGFSAGRGHPLVKANARPPHLLLLIDPRRHDRRRGNLDTNAPRAVSI